MEMTRTDIHACGHCEPDVRPAGPTPRERQPLKRAMPAKDECLAEFGIAPTKAEARLALLYLHDVNPLLVRDVLDGVVMLERGGTEEGLQAVRRYNNRQRSLRDLHDRDVADTA